MTNQTLDPNDITSDTESEHVRTECIDIGQIRSQWFRNCPGCNKILDYSRKDHFQRALLLNRTCRQCYYINKPPSIQQKFYHKCPDCDKETMYLSKSNWSRAIRCNSKCKTCSRNRLPLTSLHRQKISISRKGKCTGINHPNVKNPPTEATCLKISKALTGKIGAPASEERKRKMRIANLKRMELLGIPTSIDAGAPQWFAEYNRQTNSNFLPKRFFDIGYDADGYDPNKHIWIEYDSPYHKFRCIRNKDLQREHRIIKYFEDIGEPLVAFIRVIAYQNEKVITKYRGYGY